MKPILCLFGLSCLSIILITHAVNVMSIDLHNPLNNSLNHKQNYVYGLNQPTLSNILCLTENKPRFRTFCKSCNYGPVGCHQQNIYVEVF